MFRFLSKPNPLMVNVPSFILSIVGGGGWGGAENEEVIVSCNQ